MIVACVKVGNKYGPEYVNKLASMVARHTTRPYRFLCLTDDPKGLECWSADIATDLPGWWAKLVLFKPHPALNGSRVVFLDLDTVIVGNMDFLLDYTGPFAILRDWYWPMGYGSAIMSISPGFARQVWENFMPELMERFPGDQDWIRCMVPRADKWQDIAPDKIVSYKANHCEKAIPEDAAIVSFHGEPRPHHVQALPWMQEAWR